MADEFVKGLGVASGAGLVWMVLAGWYRTPGFEDAQLTGALPENLTAFDAAAVQLMSAMFWLMVVGALAFWVVIPLGREVAAYVGSE